MKLVGETIFGALKEMTKGDAKIGIYARGVVASDIGRRGNDWVDDS